MIETEQSAKISNGQLLEDIRLTRLEKEAYQKLMDGFSVLSELPENIQTGNSSKYNIQFKHYAKLERECAEFARKLYALKAERGIQW